MDMTATSWVTWQLLDATLPTGAFAHAGGLEAAAQSHHLDEAGDIERFVDTSLVELAHNQVPLLAAAHAAPARLGELDARCDAMLANNVANRASRAQGQALLTAAATAFDHPALDAWRRELRDARLTAHLAPTFGAVTATLGMDATAAQRVYLYTTMRDLVSAAVRFNRIGSLQAQALQYHLSPHIDRYIRLARHLAPEQACQTVSLLDILQARHDQLYSRLFHS
ncbi:MAG: urease accessory UreF family protein [Phycisphaeraceae bacterium]